jgi:hypothetical protein
MRERKHPGFDLFGDSAVLAAFIRDIVQQEVEDLRKAPMSKQDLDLSLDQFKKNVEAELGTILRIWAPANIRTYIQKKVEESAFDLVMAAMGISRDSWGKWQISKASETMNFITDAARETIDEWFTHQIGDLPDLPNTVKKAIEKEYLEHYQSEVRRRMKAEAERQALLTVTRMVAEINGDKS